MENNKDYPYCLELSDSSKLFINKDQLELLETIADIEISESLGKVFIVNKLKLKLTTNFENMFLCKNS